MWGRGEKITQETDIKAAASKMKTLQAHHYIMKCSLLLSDDPSTAEVALAATAVLASIPTILVEPNATRVPAIEKRILDIRRIGRLLMLLQLSDDIAIVVSSLKRGVSLEGSVFGGSRTLKALSTCLSLPLCKSALPQYLRPFLQLPAVARPAKAARLAVKRTTSLTILSVGMRLRWCFEDRI